MKLEIKKLTKYYKIGKRDRFKALENVNLNFVSGELVSILGESGSGKSTLMNILGGLDSSFEGDVCIDGKQLRSLPEKQLDKYRKNRVGFIFQSFNLIPHLTVLDNVAIALTLSNVKRSEKIVKAKEMLKRVGLERHMFKKPNQLSGGQKQRVAIARALMNDPDVILADEPTGALDSETSEQILKIIKEIAAQGKLIIMVTHSDKVAKISTRVINISDGKITSDKTVKQVKESKEDKDTTLLKQNLPFTSAVKLAFTNMRQKLMRNILVAVGSSIGITSVILMLSIGTGVKNYITDQMYANVNPQVIEVNQKSENKNNKTDRPIDFMEAKKAFKETDINKLEKIDNVKRVELGYSAFNGTNEISLGDTKTKLAYLLTYSSNITKTSLKEGSFPKDNEIVVDQLITKQLGTTQNKIVGKTLTMTLFLGNKKITKDVKVSGVYDNTTTANQGITQGIVNYNTVKQVFKDNGYTLEPNTLYLVANNRDNVDGIKEKIVELGYEGSILEKMINIFTDMLNVITWILSAIAGISLFVSAIMILVVLYISVVERTREIGVLKAIGARRKDIKRIFVSEAFLIGVAGGTIGVLSALGLGFAVNLITNSRFDIDLVVVTYPFMLFGLGISVLISVVAGLMPAAKAAKLEPIESLRHE